MSKALVISGFPGIGKSYLTNKHGDKVSDSDSSLFSWVKGKEGVERNPDFPSNYMEHIKEVSKTHDYVLVSSHEEVRRALEDNGINYTSVYPDIALKDEYIERYRKRGSHEKFIDLISENWDEFILSLEKESFPNKLVLKKGEFLSDVIKKG